MKKKINHVISGIEKTNKALYYKLRRIGDFNNGHLYGLPKIHKDKSDPPFRPIISMTGTVTHELSQYLNSIICPYIDGSHVLRSSEEFLIDVGELRMKPGERLVSLDVESLFTNVPVRETVDIIIERLYNHQTLPPPPLPPDTLKELLLICTTETPFEFDGQAYLQCDGVSMGSPLGPTFADFYMANIETKLLQENRASNPVYYKRYIDDIIAIFKDKRHIELFKQRLSRSSVLNFTHEEPAGNKFHFLDVQLIISNNGEIQTSVYIKPTDKGSYSNFQSHTLPTYKKSIIKTLVFRALKYCSTWQYLHVELDRIKQVLINNNYPLCLIDSVINNMMAKYIANDPNPTRKKIVLFVRLSNLSSFQKDSKLLTNIIKEHVKPIDSNSTIDLHAYFKPTKLAAYFSTRPRRPDLSRANCVYRFKCSEDGCNSAYVGHTTCLLSRRIQQHRYNASSIHKHYIEDHNRPVPDKEILSNNFTCVISYSSTIDLKIAEAIIIRDERPYINVKYNELSNFLNLYR